MEVGCKEQQVPCSFIIWDLFKNRMVLDKTQETALLKILFLGLPWWPSG